MNGELWIFFQIFKEEILGCRHSLNPAGQDWKESSVGLLKTKISLGSLKSFI